jgi:hypothetical protein
LLLAGAQIGVAAFPAPVHFPVELHLEVLAEVQSGSRAQLVAVIEVVGELVLAVGQAQARPDPAPEAEAVAQRRPLALQRSQQRVAARGERTVPAGAHVRRFGAAGGVVGDREVADARYRQGRAPKQVHRVGEEIEGKPASGARSVFGVRLAARLAFAVLVAL